MPTTKCAAQFGRQHRHHRQNRKASRAPTRTTVACQPISATMASYHRWTDSRRHQRYVTYSNAVLLLNLSRINAMMQNGRIAITCTLITTWKTHTHTNPVCNCLIETWSAHQRNRGHGACLCTLPHAMLHLCIYTYTYIYKYFFQMVIHACFACTHSVRRWWQIELNDTTSTQEMPSTLFFSTHNRALRSDCSVGVYTAQCIHNWLLTQT